MCTLGIPSAKRVLMKVFCIFMMEKSIMENLWMGWKMALELNWVPMKILLWKGNLEMDKKVENFILKNLRRNILGFLRMGFIKAKVVSLLTITFLKEFLKKDKNMVMVKNFTLRQGSNWVECSKTVFLKRQNHQSRFLSWGPGIK